MVNKKKKNLNGEPIMRTNKNLLQKQFVKCCKKVCGYNITFKRINDII